MDDDLKNQSSPSPNSDQLTIPNQSILNVPGNQAELVRKRKSVQFTKSFDINAIKKPPVIQENK